MAEAAADFVLSEADVGGLSGIEVLLDGVFEVGRHLVAPVR